MARHGRGTGEGLNNVDPALRLFLLLFTSASTVMILAALMITSLED